MQCIGTEAKGGCGGMFIRLYRVLRGLRWVDGGRGGAVREKPDAKSFWKTKNLLFRHKFIGGKFSFRQAVHNRMIYSKLQNIHIVSMVGASFDSFPVGRGMYGRMVWR